ncbi:Actin-related protein 2/3 complex subunit 3 [Mycena kentingensis (nom. inval.)]|nr:Actin-related protein 2/3 complex subunit 3 [Mycena kentingensis (nom. inval.)]
MPAYHSSFNEEPDMRLAGNMGILPIKTKIRGPAPIADPAASDIIDETLDLFRANSLFRNFEIKGPADRTLIVLILYVSDCLAKIGTARTVPTQIEAGKSPQHPLRRLVPHPRRRQLCTERSLCCAFESAGGGLPAAVPRTSPPGACCAFGRDSIRGWDGQTEQVVDELPKAQIHEQGAINECV